MIMQDLQYLLQDLKEINTYESRKIIQKEATTHNIEKALILVNESYRQLVKEQNEKASQ